MNAEQKLLNWLERVTDHTLLESQVVGSGMGKALNRLLLAGKVEIVAHPTVKDGKAPAAAVVRRKSMTQSHAMTQQPDATPRETT